MKFINEKSKMVKYTSINFVMVFLRIDNGLKWCQRGLLTSEYTSNPDVCHRL